MCAWGRVLGQGEVGVVGVEGGCVVVLVHHPQVDPGAVHVVSVIPAAFTLRQRGMDLELYIVGKVAEVGNITVQIVM